MPSELLPPAVLQQIDLRCDAFERAWRSGSRPRIEDYLEPSIEPRSALFRELLARELELRREVGEVIEAASYEERFGDFADLVRTMIADPGAGPATAVFSSGFLEDPADHLPPVDLDRTDASTIRGLLDFGAARTGRGDPPVPSRIGRFRPLRLLGRGNFLVYLALDERDGREVAIKVARPDDPFSRRRLTSLAEEAQRLACLDHPGIVKVEEFVVPTGSREANPAGGDGFIVLEYVDGQTLESRLAADEPPPLPELARIVASVAEAVHHAHLSGLVHRDLKPANILIDGRGEPRVCDFGLALNEDVQRLRKGEVAGTLYYMAPEQVRGETNRLDGRTDIWALGVILYRGLTGRLPFWGPGAAECFDEIANREPRPPRQSVTGVPRPLERICLRCLSKPMSERYLTAADLAADLRRWLSRANREMLAEPAAPASSKGLRTFGGEDAASFLALLPGPRGCDGLPESIRFWKARIEDHEGADAFSVGLLYGPSGGGKSSFLRAGLLPQLDRMAVRPIYLEAGPSGTEARLLVELRRLIPTLPREGGLAEAIAVLRDDPAVRPGEKILLVLDQFEQWLQGRPIDAAAELVRALRHCDGRSVQALLVVRDDFWMATTRLFHAVEVPLLDGANTLALELFDARHARRVLEQFGRSLDRIPAGDIEAGGPLDAFLDQAVSGLAGADGRVIPVRLCLFVEVVRQRPWVPETLRSLGGIQGIESRFLEGAFDPSSAPPANRLHREAAEAVLRRLLPAPGRSLRDAPIPERRLRQVSGYEDRPGDFADLLRVLDHDLRLIHSVESRGRAGSEPVPSSPPRPDPDPEPSYQLAHDYLIQPIRLWLERHRQATRSGRAKARLEDMTAGWLARPSTHGLPTLLEYAGIVLSTASHEWSAEEREMMRAAGRRHARRLAVTIGVTALLLLTARWVLGRMEARNALESALLMRPRQLQAQIPRLAPFRERVVSELRSKENAADLRDGQRETITLLLHRFEPTAERADRLRSYLLAAADPDRVDLIRSVLAVHPDPSGTSALHRVLDDQNAEPASRLRAACALAALEPGIIPGLPESAPVLLRALLDEGVRNLPHWLGLLGPDQVRLVDPLAEICADPRQDPALRGTAAEAIAEILKLRGDAARLAEVVVRAQPEAAAVLLRQLDRFGPSSGAARVFRAALDEGRGGDGPAAATADELARRRSMAAIGLQVLGSPDALWPLLRRVDDPRLRSLLVERLASSDLPRGWLVERLGRGDLDPKERQALLMVWAETPLELVTGHVRAQILSQAESSFRSDPDPGVHSGAELLIRRWAGPDALARLATESRAGAAGWTLGPNGHTFALVEGPLSFRMGSPESEADRFDAERLHHRRIDRSLAVSTREVTVAQYAAFDPGRRPVQRYAPDRECPMNDVDWLAAARYCNWLSRQAGIPEDQWCYPEPVRLGMVLPSDSTVRTGFRLPTEAEWEFLCRAGSLTARPFGDSVELLPRYGWTWLNSEDRSWPAGQRLPNPLGLFDMLGNVWEWCHDGVPDLGPDEVPAYPDAPARDRPAGDVAAGGAITRTARRILRGGAFDYSPGFARSAARYLAEPSYHEGTYGFRVVRTIATTSRPPSGY